MRKNIFLLSATYDRVEDGPRINLYGLTSDGERVRAVTEAFSPYFYVLEPTKTDEEWIVKRPTVRGIEKVRLEHEGNVRDFLKVYTRMPFDVPALRDGLRNAGREVFAADIPFGLRFMYDVDIGPCAEIEGEWDEGLFYLSGVGDGDPFDPPLRVMGFDIEQSQEDGRILCVGCWMEEGEQEVYDGNEQSILRNVEQYINRNDPDIITGYNTHGYDFPTLVERARLCGGTLRWGRDGSEIRVRGEPPSADYRTTGRLLVDAWRELRKETRLPNTNIRPERQTLEYVATYLGVGKKGDVDRANIDEAWRDDMAGVRKYCLNDAALAAKILDALGSTEKAVALASAAKLPIENIFDGWNSQLIDSSLIRMADRRRIAVPCMHHGGDRTDRIEGAYVKDIPKGLYEYVGVLDVKSMYPSIIKAYNICFTTLLQSGQNTIRANVSPTGSRFRRGDERKGLLPLSLEGLADMRTEAKRTYKHTGDKYYDRLQDSIKVVMNATYGVFASDFYRFTNKAIGESVTAWGRKYIKDLIETVEKRAGVEVLYADTDSIFIVGPGNQEDMNAICVSIAEKYSRGEITLEYEKLFRRFITHGAKKRYAAWQAWPDEKMVVRGYETRRGDAFPLQKHVLERVFDLALRVGDPRGAAKSVTNTLEEIRAGRTPTGDLVISRGVRDLSSYVDATKIPAARAAMKMQARNEPFTPGQKIAFVVTEETSPLEVEPYLREGEEIEYDHRYYTRRILKTVGDVMGVLGYDTDGLVTGQKQVSIDDY
jgi:DNA polymerase I